ncbi:MAG: hypothetical protein Q8P68_01080 [Candidatus Peregrinibacteria bacterium]|nr:hypothetical protein [Candidatus Peregrinibacteria bacterium]MDZ4244336.1 hypothetical protein [Candidatus Gracilibacteria bacterium]
MENEIVKSLCDKFGVSMPNVPIWQIFRHLGAFWHHFGIHTRKCDRTGRTIISVFDETCPYPVWHKDEWVKHAEPPEAAYDPERPFFEQLFELFKQCPIPHNIGSNNENCEYTDDLWYSRNCYLCHSGVKNEDAHYCYRVLTLKDSEFCVFSFTSELCTDLINSTDCFNVNFALNSRQCRDSAFLFDCRNITDSLFCWNLRNKKYCIFNKQYTEEEYKKERAKYDFGSRKIYDEGKQTFYEILNTKVNFKNVDLEQCENCTGDYLQKCKNCFNCYMMTEAEDCAHSFRAGWIKDNLLTMSSYNAELVYMSSMAQDKCYDIRFCWNLMTCKYMEYSANCLNCEYCFGCSGLVNMKYCIFNKKYSSEEWKTKVAEIKTDLIARNQYGEFFPAYFAASPYDESISGFHWPLTLSEQASLHFRVKQDKSDKHPEYLPVSDIPDNSHDADETICQKTFWDSIANRPFKITQFDLKFCKARNLPLPNCFYVRRIKENFSLTFCNGTLRETVCSKTGEKIMTGLPQSLDGRILSHEAYLDEVV